MICYLCLAEINSQTELSAFKKKYFENRAFASLRETFSPVFDET